MAGTRNQPPDAGTGRRTPEPVAGRRNRSPDAGTGRRTPEPVAGRRSRRSEAGRRRSEPVAGARSPDAGTGRRNRSSAFGLSCSAKKSGQRDIERSWVACWTPSGRDPRACYFSVFKPSGPPKGCPKSTLHGLLNSIMVRAQMSQEELKMQHHGRFDQIRPRQGRADGGPAVRGSLRRLAPRHHPRRPAGRRSSGHQGRALRRLQHPRLQERARRRHGADPGLATALLDPFWDQKTLGLICNVAEAGTLRALRQRSAHRGAARRGAAAQTAASPTAASGARSSSSISSTRSSTAATSTSPTTASTPTRPTGTPAPRRGTTWAARSRARAATTPCRPSTACTTCGPRWRGRSRRPASRCATTTTRWAARASPRSRSSCCRCQAAADATMLIKYLTRMVAREAGKTVTYMPKPLYNEAGSGMHFHQLLVRDGKSLFYDEGPVRQPEQAGPPVHRRAAAPRPRPAGADQPLDQLLQAAGARLRGAGEPVLRAGQPQRRGPHPQVRGQRAREAHRVPPARRHLQPLPGHGGPADGGHRRHPQRASTPRRRATAPSTRTSSICPRRSGPDRQDARPPSRRPWSRCEEDHEFLLRGGVFNEEMIRDLDRDQDEEATTRRCATAPTPTR